MPMLQNTHTHTHAHTKEGKRKKTQSLWQIQVSVIKIKPTKLEAHETRAIYLQSVCNRIGPHIEFTRKQKTEVVDSHGRSIFIHRKWQVISLRWWTDFKVLPLSLWSPWYGVMVATQDARLPANLVQSWKLMYNVFPGNEVTVSHINNDIPTCNLGLL